MAYFDNPAGRLLANFQQLRALPSNTSAVTAWAKVFNVEEADRSAFMTRVAKLYQFADETRDLVSALPNAAPEIYLKNFHEVEAALSHFMVVRDIHVQQFLSPISPNSGEHCLEICSHLLHVQRVERSISDQARADLVGKLDELVEAIEGAQDLEADTRTWVLARLAEVRSTLTEQRIYGVEDTDSAVDKLLGGVMRKIHHLSSLGKSGVVTKFVAFAVAIDLAINVGANTHELISGDSPKSSPIVIEIQNRMSSSDLDSVPALPGTAIDEEGAPK